MIDIRLDDRQREYRKTIGPEDLLLKREIFNLSLRKQKLDEMLLNKRFKRNHSYFIDIEQPFEQTNHIYTNKDTTNNGVPNLSLSSYSNRQIDPILKNVYSTDKNTFFLNFEKEVQTIFQTLDIFENTTLNHENLKFALFLIRLYISHNENTKIDILKEHRLIEKVEVILDIELLDEFIIYEIYWIITNFSFLGGYEENKILVNKKFLCFHYKYLNSYNSEVKDQIMWALTNITCENIEFRNILFTSPILERIQVITYNALNHRDLNLLKICSNFLLFSLNYDKVTNEFSDILMKIAFILKDLILNTSGEIYSNSLWALLHIGNIQDKNIPQKLYKKLITKNPDMLIKILSIDFDNLKTELISTIRIIGNLLSIDDEEFIYYVLNFNIFSFFDKILSTEKNKKIKQEIIWATSNIIKQKSKLFIKNLVESNLYNRISQIANDYDPNLKKEAVLFIYEICINTHFNISTELIKKGTFRILTDLLEISSDHQIILNCLEAIDKILASGEFLKTVLKGNTIANKFEAVGGLECLEKFQLHMNIKIYEKAMDIIEKYFQSSYSENMLSLSSKHADINEDRDYEKNTHLMEYEEGSGIKNYSSFNYEMN